MFALLKRDDHPATLLLLALPFLLTSQLSCEKESPLKPVPVTDPPVAEALPGTDDRSNGDDLIQDLLDRFDSRRAERPLLQGESVDGNGWDDYSIALKQSVAYKTRVNLFADFLRSPNPTSRERVSGVVKRHSYG